MAEGFSAQGGNAKAKAAAKRRKVTVVPLGEVDELALSVAAANIQAIVGINVDVAAPRPDPAYAIMAGRGQYNAIPILKDLGRQRPGDTLCLGILNGDLCLPFLSHVFGEAQVNGKAAVMSLHRLQRGPDGRKAASSLFLERLAKIAVHEIAHVLGLTHCRIPHCIMAYALDLEFLDGVRLAFCPDCEPLLRQCLA